MKTSRRGFLGGGLKLGGLAALGTLLGQKPDLLKEAKVAPTVPAEEPIVVGVTQPVPAAIKEAGQNTVWSTCSVTFSCMVASTNAAGWPFRGQIESLDAGPSLAGLYGRNVMWGTPEYTKRTPEEERKAADFFAALALKYGEDED